MLLLKIANILHKLITRGLGRSEIRINKKKDKIQIHDHKVVKVDSRS